MQFYKCQQNHIFSYVIYVMSVLVFYKWDIG